MENFEFFSGIFQQISAVFQWDFSIDFSSFSVELKVMKRRKMASILCTRLHEKQIFTKKKLCDPYDPPKTIILGEKKIMCFDKVVNIVFSKCK